MNKNIYALLILSLFSAPAFAGAENILNVKTGKMKLEDTTVDTSTDTGTSETNDKESILSSTQRFSQHQTPTEVNEALYKANQPKDEK